MPIVLRIALVTVLIFAACAVARADMRVTAKSSLDGAKTYQRLEWSVELDRIYANPFDPDQIAIDATFAGPGGQTLVVPAFWNRDRFVVRFAAPTPGEWSMKAVARDATDTRTLPPQSFNVAKGDDNGFVRRTPGNSRYFQFDSGKPYFVLGLNIAWAGKRGLDGYETWFEELSSNGGNFARIWMSHPSEMTETVDAGIGRYDHEAVEFYDKVLDLAQSRGIYCMVTLNNYRDLRASDEWGPATWPRFPYNAANGGPATRPAEFFTSAECRRLYRQRLRYVAARWSAYTSVAMWEFWNEQTFTKVHVPPAWTREMAQYLRSVDPYDHLISTSFGEGEQAEVWRMPEIDWTQSHLYPGEQCDDSAVAIASSSYAHRVFGKPHFVSEFGIGTYTSDAKLDPDGVGTNLHNAIWASMMSGGAGTACVWWWDDYVHPRKLWREFAAPAAFSSRVEWNKRAFEPLAVPPPLRPTIAEGETFSDIVITSALPWGRAHGEPIEVLANGQPTRALPQYLYGPRKSAYRTPTVLRVDLPRATTMIVRVAKVSDHATMRVLVDGAPKQDFFFSALPGAPGQKKTAMNEHKLFEAEFDLDCPIELPAGKHDIGLAIVGGDWLTVQSVRFVDAKSSKIADLHVLALHDRASGETLAWLRDPASNWQNDRAKTPPRTITDARVKLPVGRDATYVVEWWDTRTGKIVQTDHVKPDQATLMLSAPPVHRDIALRATVFVGAP
jgi:hypothetical protein